MANKKHYVIVSITLGAIAASSALLIGGANLLTKQAIANNEENKINRGIAAIFGDSAQISKQSKIENDDYKFVNYCYQIKKDNNDIGVIYRTTGSNMYGKISMLVGFNASDEFVSMSIIANEQTYAQALIENYIEPVKDGKRDYIDVNCGATYGAKLIRDMINEAEKANEDLKGLK